VHRDADDNRNFKRPSYEVALNERKDKFTKQAASRNHSVGEITASLLFFDNLDDAIKFAPLPHKKDELMRYVRRVKGGSNFIADKIFSEEYFNQDVERELRNAGAEFSSFSFFIDADERKNTLKYIEVDFGSSRAIPVKDLRSFSLFASMFMTVKKNDGCNAELIYGVLLKNDDLSRRGGLVSEPVEVRVMCISCS